MIYAMVCFNSRTADHRLRQFVKKNYPFVKRHLCGLAGSFYAIMQNGDEYHFVPEFVFPRWQIGRHIVMLEDEWEIEREEKMTTEEMREYEKVRNKYESPFALYRKTDAEIAIAQENELKSVRGQVDRLKEIADKANAEIKKLNEENKALVEENAKLKKESKALTFESDGGLFNIEYQGMKFKATRLVIDKNCVTRRTMHIDATMVSE